MQAASLGTLAARPLHRLPSLRILRIESNRILYHVIQHALTGKRSMIGPESPTAKGSYGKCFGKHPVSVSA